MKKIFAITITALLLVACSGCKEKLSEKEQQQRSDEFNKSIETYNYNYEEAQKYFATQTSTQVTNSTVETDN